MFVLSSCGGGGGGSDAGGDGEPVECEFRGHGTLELLLDADRLLDLVNLSGGCDGLSVILNSTAVTGP